MINIFNKIINILDIFLVNCSLIFTIFHLNNYDNISYQVNSILTR